MPQASEQPHRRRASGANSRLDEIEAKLDRLEVAFAHALAAIQNTLLAVDGIITKLEFEDWDEPRH